jgi:flagellar hook-associated protein 3 FlgL
LKDQLVSLANSQLNGYYLFGVTKTSSPPFNSSGEYIGSDKTREVIIGKNVTIKINTPGSETFAPGGNNIFTTTDDLVSALENNNPQGILDILDSLEEIFNSLNGQLAKVGAQQNLLQRLSDVQEEEKFNQTGLLANIEEIDLVEATISLKQAENTYNAALAASIQIMNLGLTNFIKQ